MAYYTVTQASEKAGISRLRTYDLIKEGRVKVTKFGRDYMLDDAGLDQLINRGDRRYKLNRTGEQNGEQK